MKLVSYSVDNQTRFGALLSGERVMDLTNVYPTALAFLDAGEIGMTTLLSAVERAERGEALAGQVRPLDGVRLRPPVPQARKLLAVAANYREHIREVGRPTYPKEETYPYFFLKPASTALLGSGGEIKYPPVAQQLDYEAELGIVIGQRGKNIPEERAYRYIAGYTIVNDVSERALASKAPPKVEREQNKFFDWLMGKWYDTGAPCGPCLVTREEIEDPHSLRIRTWVNGDLRQDSSTAEMIFSIPELIAFISRYLTLEPGDLIATGTPHGVGKASGRFLKPGDSVEIEIERIGTLRSTIVAEAG
jgi:2-keto-4-pentenoate hydratase/2-oxohepta-3-ene-1,7-dioic acid hydratase in catechol pathway